MRSTRVSDSIHSVRYMMRRSLFFGLTLILLAALASLMYRGCRAEESQPVSVREVIKESKPSALRVYAPADLEILHSGFNLENGMKTDGDKAVALHDVELRNHGTASYQSIRLAFDYLDARKRKLATIPFAWKASVMPGADVKITGLKIDSVPPAARTVETRILYADLQEIP